MILLGIGIGVVFGYRRMRQRQIRLEREFVGFASVEPI